MEVFGNDGTVVTAWVLETLCWLFMWWNLSQERPSFIKFLDISHPLDLLVGCSISRRAKSFSHGSAQKSRPDLD